MGLCVWSVIVWVFFLPEPGAVHLLGTEGVRDSKVLSEEQQGNQDEVKAALTHKHVHQRGALS